MQYFIIDGLNLAYRAHNVNFELKTSTSLFSGMFFGFVRTILSLKKKYRGYKFVVAWDSRPVEKYALQDDYKAGRSSLPSGVFSQVDDLMEFLKNCNVDQYSMEGEEADDVMASLAERFKKEGANTVIVYTNDKDLLQIVETGKIVVYKPKVGMSPEKFYDESAVLEQFGVPPSKLSLYRSLDGDSSDNITGIERVPRKIIARVVNASNTMDDFYATLSGEDLTEFQKKSFQEGKERAYKNVILMTLKRNLSCIVKNSSGVNVDKVNDLFKKFEIRSIKADVVTDLFSSDLNVRYSEAMPAFKVESYSLF